MSSHLKNMMITYSQDQIMEKLKYGQGLDITVVGSVRKSQTALEYLILVAITLLLVSITLRVIIFGMKTVNTAISNYTKEIQERIIQNL